MSIAKNLTKSKLEKYSRSDIFTLITVYIEVCQTLGVNPDNIYLVKDIEHIKPEDLWMVASFLIAYENICIIEGYRKEDVSKWFKSSLEYNPFNGKTPIQYICKSNCNHKILELRFFTSALLTAYNHRNVTN